MGSSRRLYRPMFRIDDAVGRYAILAIAAAIWIAPSAADVARYVWTTDQGAQGPLILVTGLWLLAVRLREHAGERRPGSFGLALGMLVGALLVYVLARMINILSLQLLSIWLGSIALLYAYVGPTLLRGLAFPLAYLLFLIPPPFFLTAPVIQLLKLWIAAHVTAFAATIGLDVANSGSMMFVDQYELSIEAACAGLNSLFSMLAIGALYIHLRHSKDWRHGALLALAIVPAAVGANMIRVFVLVLLVHQFGGAILDTPLHAAAGLTMTLIAMVLIVALDTLLLWARRSGRRGQPAAAW